MKEPKYITITCCTGCGSEVDLQRFGREQVAYDEGTGVVHDCYGLDEIEAKEPRESQDELVARIRASVLSGRRD